MGKVSNGFGIDASEFAELLNGAFLRYQVGASGDLELAYISSTCEKIWGYTAKEILADSSLLWRTVDPVNRARLSQVIKAAIRTQGSWSEEWLIRDRNGAARWLKGNGIFRETEDGQKTWAVVITDNTSSSRIALLNEVTAANFRNLADHLDDIAVHRFGADMKVTYWNAASTKVYGYTEDEALGMDVLDLLIPINARENWRRSFAEIMANRRRSSPFEAWLQRKDRSYIEVKGNVILLEYPDKAVEFVCMDYDLSPRRKHESEKASLEAQLRQSQKLEALGTLAGGVAHDFNNILAAILGNARLALMDAQGNEELIQSINEIKRAGHRAKDLVQRILSFSRLNVPSRKVVSMDLVVAESIQLLKATVPKSITIDVDVDPRTPKVLADTSQLHQVFLNLCTNAIQAMATPESGRLRIVVAPYPGQPVAMDRPGTLNVFTDASPWPAENVYIAVEDNGCGMDEATLTRLMEPFFTTKAVGEGTGLGMPVVHGILRDHQAAMIVESAPGVGSVFKIYLRGADGMQAVDSPDDTEDEDSSLPTAFVDKRSQTLSVLYVDDDESIVDLASRLLARAGYSVSVASSGVKALEDVRSGAIGYDLCVVDYSMPDLNGLDLARELLRLHPDKPVAITSGFISDDLRKSAPEVGVADLINKPNTGTGLLQAIERLARRIGHTLSNDDDLPRMP